MQLQPKMRGTSWLEASIQSKDKISGMLKEQDGQKKLAAKSLIKVYAGQAGKAWQALLPDLQDLTDEPYISIKQSKPTFGEVLSEIKAEASKVA